MTEQELRNQYSSLCENIASRRLKPAFEQLGNLISGQGLGIYFDEYRSLEETYQFMLKYTLEGIRDPERQKVYQKLIVSLFELTDKVHESIRMRISSSPEYEKKRMFREKHIPDPEAFVKKLEDHYTDTGDSLIGYENPDHLNRIRQFFYYTWFMDKMSRADQDAILSCIQSSLLPVYYRSFMVSALTMSLQRFFDEEKYNLLFHAYDTNREEIRQRALVGILICLYKYDYRIPYLPALSGRLNVLSERDDFKHNTERIIFQFIRSRETEKLVRRIRDEILPEMIRISPNLRNKINLEGLLGEGPMEDKNPDWEELFSDSPGLLNKMEEFSEMQLEGADVFMGSFSNLKMFPFFREISNWLMPFFPENPDISSVSDVKGEKFSLLLDAVAETHVLCNSDKYSLCFSINMLPAENMDFIANGLAAESEQLKEIKEDEAVTQPWKLAESISNQYIQDLYRFYRLFPGRAGLEDIFEWKFDFHNKSALRPIWREDPKILRNIAEYYFSRDYFTEAAEIFSFLLESDKNGELYQKIAFCHQKTGDYTNALEGYLKAELYDVNRLWNLRKIALCYRNLKEPLKALEYYREAELLDPDDLHTCLNIGHCLLETDAYEEALRCYFRVEYLSPGNRNVWRPIAWCSFLTGRKEQSEKYFLKLMEYGPNRYDFMNMGHVQWSMGNRREALEYYRRAISPEGFSTEGFMEVFEEDLPHLLKQGIDADDVPIMLDQLRYLLET